MKLLLSKPRGFCAGVVRAIETVKRALEIWGAPIYVKHQIVHNMHVVKDLEKKGAIFIENIDEVPIGSRIIYSAHGIPPSVRENAQKRKLIEIDASCGLVIRVHSAVKRYAAKGYHVLLIGHRNHVEIVGTHGQAPDSTTIIESVHDVKSLNFNSETKLFYTTQTTLSLDDVKDITNALVEKYPNIKTLPTPSICYATTNRQMALKNITNSVDITLVIGDPMSSNSNRLCEMSIKQGTPAYLINFPNEIKKDWFKGVKVIGLTAGASTPEPVVQDCIKYLKSLGVKDIKEVEHTQEDVFFQLPKEVLANT